MCLGAVQSANSSEQRILATKRNATCFHGCHCIHGLQCWGVHTSAELRLFRQREGLAQAIEQRSPHSGFSTVVAVCRDALYNEARRWYDREELAKSKDEFFDTELIPRRRAHRRLRKRQRASHRRQQRQQMRRAHIIKRRWLNILAKGERKRHTLQQRQREQLEQKGVEMEAAEALLQEAGKVQAILKKQVTQLRSKVERQDVDLRLQESFIQDSQQNQQQQQQCHREPWEWSEEELLQLVDQQESELEAADRLSAEKDQQQEQLWLKVSEQNLQMAKQQVHIETLERLLGMGDSGLGIDRVSDRVRIEQCAASTQCSSAEIEEEIAQLSSTEAEKAVAKAVAQEEETEERFWAKCREAGEAGVDRYWESVGAAAGEGEARVGVHKNWCELAKVERGVLSRELANAARLGCSCGALDRQDKEQRKRDRNKKKREKKRDKKRGEEGEKQEFRSSINQDPFVD